MKYILPAIFLLFFFTGILYGCKENYDPELQTPDIDDAGMTHGYYLTPLGCLVNAPWNLYTYDSSKTTVLNSTVFELQKNGTLKYWFKSDYLKSPIDTITQLDGKKSIGHHKMNSKFLLENKWLKNIYTNGSWKANFKDSTIQIDFGKNNFSLLPIQGKYILSGGEMRITQIAVISSQDGSYHKTYLNFTHY